jgi:small conductance mechanosensitive channel
VIPNKQIYQNKVLNHSASGTRRVDLACGVSYGDDLEEVRRVVRDTLASVEPRDRFRDVEVFFTGFGSSSIHLVGRFWVDYEKQPDFLDAQSRAIIAVKKAFDANDIVIPFPIRTLDFGIRGGRPLAESFPKIEVNGRSQEAS